MGGGIPPPYVRKKIRILSKWWLLLHFLNLNTDLIVSKTKVKNSQNPIALVQDYCKIGILPMIGTHQLVYKDLTRGMFLLHFRDIRRCYFFWTFKN